MEKDRCSVCGQVMSESEKYNDNMCWDCKYGGHEELEKDWTGNKKSTFVTLGSSSHCDHDRAKNDFYSTDPKALEVFLERIKDELSLSLYIWECACGNGALSKVLEKNGYEVFSSDLVDRGYGHTNSDFFSWKCLPYENEFRQIEWDILTNPPYKYAKEFVEHALDLVHDGSLVIMFLKIQFLEGQQRRALFDKYPPKYIYVNSARQICYLNGNVDEKMSSATCYCWYVWEKGWHGEPTIRWI